MSEHAKPPIAQGLITTVVVIAACALLVLVMEFLGVPTWIPFLALTSLGATGISFNWKNVAKIWISAAVGLLIVLALGSIGQYGVPAICVAAVGILLMIFAMCSQRMTFVFNIYTALYVVAGTLPGAALDPVSTVKGLAFGFIVLGLLPCALLNLKAQKQA